MGLTGRDQKDKYAKICHVKSRMSFDEVCHGFRPESLRSFHVIRALHFSECPNYAELRVIFRSLFIREGCTYDYRYDWGGRRPTHTRRPPPPPPPPAGDRGLHDRRAIAQADIRAGGPPRLGRATPGAGHRTAGAAASACLFGRRGPTGDSEAQTDRHTHNQPSESPAHRREPRREEGHFHPILNAHARRAVRKTHRSVGRSKFRIFHFCLGVGCDQGGLSFSFDGTALIESTPGNLTTTKN
jgi:hypothetical protein